MRFHGQFEPPLDQYLWETFFIEKKDPGFFVECGAFDGVYDSSCLMFEESLGWTGVNIEASPVIFPLLEKQRPNSTNLQIALSRNSGTATFRHVSDAVHGDFLGWGSLEHQPAQAAEISQERMLVTEWQVQTCAWRDCEILQTAGNIDLFVLDVEGHEIAVIDGMAGAAVLPKVLCVEHGQVGIELLKGKLLELGFEFVSSLHVNSFFVLKL
ncbi:FkbM family methyltransferase [Sphingomonas sediminicola]|uniref:FkbM family methyltransferase n=1 Tax=Sphingomonas sediminicola TaxID=386874 RepID=A0ABX6T9N4_9SPHN|nr:FkbM family methyltransferase [Sphingomonas sediminicola]QNP46495.1 FkbM family methyltransferase [Sphingomonas sediminicola]